MTKPIGIGRIDALKVNQKLHYVPGEFTKFPHLWVKIISIYKASVLVEIIDILTSTKINLTVGDKVELSPDNLYRRRRKPRL